MKERMKNIAAVILVILLLPYVIAMIWNGDSKKEAVTAEVKDKYVIVPYGKGEDKIEIEQYIVGVLPSQIPITYQKEAIKAQALIIRTQLLKVMDDASTVSEKDTGLHYMTPDDMEALWGNANMEDNYAYLAKLVAETTKEALYYQNTLIEPSYHAVSAGKTRDVSEMLTNTNVSYPYFVSVDSDWDRESEHYLQSLELDKTKVIACLQAKEKDLQVTQENLMDNLEILERDNAGYVNSIKIGGVTMTGEDFRSSLSLNSADFTIDEYEGKVRFITKGLGHGIGLSQYGANCMAKDGRNYKEILKYYYKDVEIKRYDE